MASTFALCYLPRHSFENRRKSDIAMRLNDAGFRYKIIVCKGIEFNSYVF